MDAPKTTEHRSLAGQSFILIIESYEATPPWGTHEWNEICAGQQQEARRLPFALPSSCSLCPRISLLS